MANQSERDSEAWRAAMEGVRGYTAQEDQIVTQAITTEGGPDTMEAARSALGEARFEDGADTRFRPTPGKGGGVSR